MRAIAYVRCSTEDQAQSGLGLDAQRAAIRDACAQRGIVLCEIAQDVVSGGSRARPGLDAALEQLRAGEADALIVARVDRLTRSLQHFAEIMEMARRQGWSLVALDLGVDTSTAAGEMLANVLASFAQFERRLIGERTREALARKRVECGGRLPGSRPAASEAVRARVRGWRAEGWTLDRIAARLDADGVATTQGGRWRRSSVAYLLR